MACALLQRLICIYFECCQIENRDYFLDLAKIFLFSKFPWKFSVTVFSFYEIFLIRENLWRQSIPRRFFFQTIELVSISNTYSCCSFLAQKFKVILSRKRVYFCSLIETFWVIFCPTVFCFSVQFICQQDGYGR